MESKKLVPCYLDYPLGKKTNKQTNKWTIKKQTNKKPQTNKQKPTLVAGVMDKVKKDASTDTPITQWRLASSGVRLGFLPQSAR